MNGIAERVNRVLAEHGSAMLWTAELPIGFWVPAILVATFLKNRSPTKVLDMTPYEAYYGKKPNLGFIRTFGCQAKAFIPAELRSKTEWDAKSGDFILIGYFETENLYELWDVKKGTIVRARDVVFWEDRLGSEFLKPFALPNSTNFLPISNQYMAQYIETHTPPDVPPIMNNIRLNPINQGRNIPTLQTEEPSSNNNNSVFIDMNKETENAVLKRTGQLHSNLGMPNLQLNPQVPQAAMAIGTPMNLMDEWSQGYNDLRYGKIKEVTDELLYKAMWKIDRLDISIDGGQVHSAMLLLEEKLKPKVPRSIMEEVYSLSSVEIVG